MSDVSESLREVVIDRANNRCEYCQLSQQGQEATFHVDHVIPRSAGGLTVADNLALACVSCSLRKWAHQAGVDPESGEIAPLFNPRLEAWIAHFSWNGAFVVPKSPTGRATLELLQLNRPLMVAIREEEVMLGRHPAG